MTDRPSTAGYAKDAEKLVAQYESSSFEEVYAKTMHLFPSKPCRVLDIGAGSGRDAAALAKLGHDVVAVEPTKEMREAGKKLHADVPLVWIDDALPELELLRSVEYGGPYACILMAAVWMHFDEREREKSMGRVAELLAPGGRFILSLRHGPVPEGRRMYDISPEETIALGARHGLGHVMHVLRDNLHGRKEITWTFMCLGKPK